MWLPRMHNLNKILQASNGRRGHPDPLRDKIKAPEDVTYDDDTTTGGMAAT